MKRKPNPIIAAIECSYLKGGVFLFDVDRHRSPNTAIDGLLANGVGDATIREIGFLVVKALLLGDWEIERTVKDALKECDHIFKRDRERVLRKKVLKELPDLFRRDPVVVGSDAWRRQREEPDIVAFKKEIEERCNCGKKLTQSQWNRLRKSMGLVAVPVGAPKKSGKKRP